MSCKDAMISKDKIIVSAPDAIVRDVVAQIKESDYTYAIVVDDAGKYLGRVGARTIIKRLLPKVVTLDCALGHLDFVLGAEPGFAKDLKSLKKGTVGDAMRSDIETVCPDTSAIEGMRILVDFGSPIAVADKETGEFFGVITEESVLKLLSKSVKALEEHSREEAEEGQARDE